MSIVTALWGGIDDAFFMFWETLWALVLGFALSGAVQAFVSRDQMQAALGDHRPATLARSSFFGVVSSSCSYASSALAKTLFARGADFTASMIFMIASTNLVVELGIVLWLLIGWQFALAEFVGGAVMIVLLGLVLPRVIPASWIEDARDRLTADRPSAHRAGQLSHDHGDQVGPGVAEPFRDRVRGRAGWADASAYTISDLTMLRKELVIGFVVAGYLAARVPAWFWRSLFITGHGWWSSLENVLLGPFLAIISFVCSVGNVPLAAALWQGGISFGGVVSFVFADLITLPLLSIYRTYFGTAITLRLLASFWATMSTAGLAVEVLFRAVGIADPARPRTIVHTGFQLDYTSVLDVIALVAFAVLYRLYRTRDATAAARYAEDPVCGMQVEKLHAPAEVAHAGIRYWFCSDRCRERFVHDPQRFIGGRRLGADRGPRDEEAPGRHAPAPIGAGEDAHAVDPVCGMAVDPATTPHRATHDGIEVVLCSSGCQQAFTADPQRYPASLPSPPAVGLRPAEQDRGIHDRR